MAQNLKEHQETDSMLNGHTVNEDSVSGHSANGRTSRDANTVPRLEAGDYLTRAEFERRYKAHPEIKKAELIEGIVYMPSPVRSKVHGRPHFTMISWLGAYSAATPGVYGDDNSTLRLDLLNEPQPDAALSIDPDLGGGASVDDEGYLIGSPELVLEIAASTSSYDMNQKKAVYARHGIQEYLVVLPLAQRIAWFTLVEGVYVELDADEQDILRSQVLPGLWLQPSGIWTNDIAAILTVLQDGLVSSDHDAFVKQLASNRV